MKLVMDAALGCVLRRERKTCDLMCVGRGARYSLTAVKQHSDGDEAWQDWQQWEFLLSTATNKNSTVLLLLLLQDFYAHICIPTYDVI